MNITDYEIFVVANPPLRRGGRYFIFIKLQTDSGVTGYGEIYCATFGAEAVATAAADTIERHVVGHDPFHVEKLWRRIYGAGYTSRPDVTLVSVLSGIEMACWDIIGKECDKPVYELLGGRVHERLRTYTYIYPESGDTYEDRRVYDDADAAAERALDYLRQGFSALKFDPAGPYTVFDGGMPTLRELDRSERFMKTLRDAVGDKADLIFGTHGQFTAAGAIRLARRLEPYDPLWFEEPVPPDNPAEMARVAAGTTIPVATGERLCTKYEFARILECSAASILQMNLGRVGGLLEAKKIAGIAETRHAQLAPHLYCGPIVGAANIQLAACSPNFLILESIERWDGFHADLLETPIRWEEGFVGPAQNCTSSRGRTRYASPNIAPAVSPDNLTEDAAINIGFIGLGNAGGKLAGSLVRNQCAVTVHDLDRTAAEPLIEQGARWAGSPAEVAHESAVVITCLPSPAASASVMEDENGVLGAIRPGTIWLEMSTTDEAEVKRLGALVEARDGQAADCPVSGGCHRAATGNISIFAGCERDTFDAVLPVLKFMGRRILHTGPLGTASVLKVVTNFLATANLVSLCEALVTSKAAGMDLDVAYEAIRISSGNSFVHETESQVILNGSRDINFTMGLVSKDIGLFHAIAERCKIPLEVAPMLIDIFKDGEARYGADEWSPNIVRRLEEATGLEILAPGFPAEMIDDEPEEPGYEVLAGPARR
jgi:L-alanine-DL-glutamate epimerase-like enolase superfamily enzyme/3-hydroxyisobutyrate dehydrogenase-like beta-hydroxyacid dehydrogenase